MTIPTSPIRASFAAELRDSTTDLHSEAEKSALQRLLVTGRAGKSAYAEHLVQMLIVHRALDSALRSAAQSSPAVAAVVRDEQYQEPYLLEDLAFLQRDVTTAVALPATQEIADAIRATAATDPTALLGYHYVLEGANNGNRYIARAMAGPLGVRPGSAGTRYLDPYGERQRELWSTFKVQLDAIELSPESRVRAVACAKAMFQAVTRIGEQILERTDAGVVVMERGPSVVVERN